jgi:hypothetical protein
VRCGHPKCMPGISAGCSANGCYSENARNFKQALTAIARVERKRPRSGGGMTTMLIGYKLAEEEFFLLFKHSVAACSKKNRLYKKSLSYREFSFYLLHLATKLKNHKKHWKQLLCVNTCPLGEVKSPHLFHLDNGRGATRKKTRFQTGYIPHI